MSFPVAQGFDIQRFVNRKEEIDAFLSLVNSVRQGDNISSYKRVLHIVGKSGIGKSSLLLKYHYELTATSNYYLPLIINLESFINLPNKQFILSVMQSINEKVSKELGITTLIDEGKGFSLNEYSSLLKTNIALIQKSKVVVFLFDEVNMLSFEQASLLEDYLLVNLLNQPNVLAVLTGRHVVTGWKDFNLRPTQGEQGNVIELLGFNFDNTIKQIQMLHPQASQIASKIYEISGGSPGNNKTILSQVADDDITRLNEVDAIRACNQELYEAIAITAESLPHKLAEEIIPALEALCVLQDFDKEYEAPIMFASHKDLSGDWDVKRCASLISLLGKIQIGPGRLIDWDLGKSALAIEEQIRFNLEQELKFREQDLWEILHCTAMKMYAQWAKEYDSDIFAHKAEYHRSVLKAANFDPDHC